VQRHYDTREHDVDRIGNSAAASSKASRDARRGDDTEAAPQPQIPGEYQT